MFLPTGIIIAVSLFVVVVVVVLVLVFIQIDAENDFLEDSAREVMRSYGYREWYQSRIELIQAGHAYERQLLDRLSFQVDVYDSVCRDVIPEFRRMWLAWVGLQIGMNPGAKDSASARMFNTSMERVRKTLTGTPEIKRFFGNLTEGL